MEGIGLLYDIVWRTFAEQCKSSDVCEVASVKKANERVARILSGHPILSAHAAKALVTRATSGNNVAICQRCLFKKVDTLFQHCEPGERTLANLSAHLGPNFCRAFSLDTSRSRQHTPTYQSRLLLWISYLQSSVYSLGESRGLCVQNLRPVCNVNLFESAFDARSFCASEISLKWASSARAIVDRCRQSMRESSSAGIDEANSLTAGVFDDCLACCDYVYAQLPFCRPSSSRFQESSKTRVESAPCHLLSIARNRGRKRPRRSHWQCVVENVMGVRERGDLACARFLDRTRMQEGVSPKCAIRDVVALHVSFLRRCDISAGHMKRSANRCAYFILACLANGNGDRTSYESRAELLRTCLIPFVVKGVHRIGAETFSILSAIVGMEGCTTSPPSYKHVRGFDDLYKTDRDSLTKYLLMVCKWQLLLGIFLNGTKALTVTATRVVRGPVPTRVSQGLVSDCAAEEALGPTTKLFAMIIYEMWQYHSSRADSGACRKHAPGPCYVSATEHLLNVHGAFAESAPLQDVFDALLEYWGIDAMDAVIDIAEVAMRMRPQRARDKGFTLWMEQRMANWGHSIAAASAILQRRIPWMSNRMLVIVKCAASVCAKQAKCGDDRWTSALERIVSRASAVALSRSNRLDSCFWLPSANTSVNGECAHVLRIHSLHPPDLKPYISKRAGASGGGLGHSWRHVIEQLLCYSPPLHNRRNWVLTINRIAAWRIEGSFWRVAQRSLHSAMPCKLSVCEPRGTCSACAQKGTRIDLAAAVQSFLFRPDTIPGVQSLFKSLFGVVAECENRALAIENISSLYSRFRDWLVDDLVRASAHEFVSPEAATGSRGSVDACALAVALVPGLALRAMNK